MGGKPFKKNEKRLCPNFNSSVSEMKATIEGQNEKI
jgi:hypothetical protein